MLHGQSTAFIGKLLCELDDDNIPCDYSWSFGYGPDSSTVQVIWSCSGYSASSVRNSSWVSPVPSELLDLLAQIFVCWCIITVQTCGESVLLWTRWKSQNSNPYRMFVHCSPSSNPWMLSIVHGIQLIKERLSVTYLLNSRTFCNQGKLSVNRLYGKNFGLW